MGVIARTYDFVNGNIAQAEEVDTDLNALYNEINGNLDVTNLKAAAGILGTMLAAAPNGIPTTRINDLAVTAAKIADLSILSGKLKITTHTALGSNFFAPNLCIILGSMFTPVLPPSNLVIPLTSWVSSPGAASSVFPSVITDSNSPYSMYFLGYSYTGLADWTGTTAHVVCLYLA